MAKSTDAALAALRERDGAAVAHFEFVQWVADQQLAACRQRAHDLALPIGLYLDIAVGVRPDGFDAWSDQDLWCPGFPWGRRRPLQHIRAELGTGGLESGCLGGAAIPAVRQMLRASMRNAGAIRLDHVLGLKRLFLIPDGMRADQGVYVRFPFEALLAVAAQESVQQRCVVIGEDLGTVPEDFRATLSDWGIWSYQVMLFERAPDGASWRRKPTGRMPWSRSAPTISRPSRAGAAPTISPSSVPSTWIRARPTKSARPRRPHCAMRCAPRARPASIFPRSPASWPGRRRDFWWSRSRMRFAFATRPTFRRPSTSTRTGGAGCPLVWRIFGGIPA